MSYFIVLGLQFCSLYCNVFVVKETLDFVTAHHFFVENLTDLICAAQYVK